MLFTDAAEVKGARITRDGYLVADAYVGRANNIQVYTAKELGFTDRAPNERIRIFRPESAVFAKKTMDSLGHRPVTVNHPGEDVTAANWKKYAVGDVGDEMLRDGDRIRVPIKVMDQGAIRAIGTTHGEFSLGYDADIDMTPGIHDGQEYDGSIANVVFNHLAAVPNARGGSELRIVDERIPEKTMKTIIVDGIPVADVSDAAEAVITTLQRRLADALALVATRDEAIVKHVADASTQAGEIAGLTQKVKDAEVSPAKLEVMVRDRALVIDAAKRIAGDKLGDTAGLTDAAIRKAAVTAKMGDDAVKDMDDGAIAGAFKVLTPIADASDDGIRNVLRDAGAAGAGQGVQDARAKAEAARKKYHDELANPPKAA